MLALELFSFVLFARRVILCLVGKQNLKQRNKRKNKLNLLKYISASFTLMHRSNMHNIWPAGQIWTAKAFWTAKA